MVCYSALREVIVVCRKRGSLPTVILPLVLVGLIAGCEGSSPKTPSAASQPAKEVPMAAKITLQSTAFQPNDPVPRRYTGDGEDKSPPLSWSDVPAGTKELALIVDDPDAPTKTPWVHWVLYRIPPDLKALPEGIAPSLRVSQPAGLLQGKNSWGKVGYGGPSPPKGHGTHRYFFKIYALDAPVTLEAGADKEALLKAMAGHILAEGEVLGTYKR
jgi:Raf kinase inhibitor-like YbhB/YbcL family protein